MIPRTRMESTTQKVLLSYKEKITSLSAKKQFHFNSRMFLWTKEMYYKKRVILLKDTLLENLDESLENTKNPTAEYSKKFLPLRKSALEKYPWIIRYNVVLFKWLFLKTIFKDDIRKKILSTISEKTLREYAQSLLNDPPSLIMLSTFGINFLYLTRGILQDKNLFHPKQFLDMATKYYASISEHVELELYFFTHCIIGESQFYDKPVQNNIKVYADMIRASEKILGKHFATISIDNKVELLVAAELCHIKSVLFEKIQKECEENFSEKLGFISEPRKPIEKQNLGDEEHRNVLYIMSNLKFSVSRP